MDSVNEMLFSRSTHSSLCLPRRSRERRGGVERGALINVVREYFLLAIVQCQTHADKTCKLHIITTSNTASSVLVCSLNRVCVCLVN